jgi:hypothetical protein
MVGPGERQLPWVWTPAFAADAERRPQMAFMGLATRECNGQVAVSLRGQLNVPDAASVAVALEQFVARARLVM